MKKVLSWALVLALVLSSFAMSFAGDTINASAMKDADKIVHKEAVDVMVATGIIGGYPDGYFYPEKTVTRAEMAKMISVALSGGDDVGTYYASACKFSDAKDTWAAGYVGYCANSRIIDGRNDDIFDPNATVTGTEAAKMVLVALGYDTKIEGYVGSNWATNVLKKAKELKLFDEIENFVAGDPLTRDNAAQIIFNALQKLKVEYDYDAKISVGNTEVSVNTKAQETDYALYEKAFDGDLVKKDADSDNFKRPAHSWIYEKEKIGTYVDTADFTFIATEDKSFGKALKAYDENFYDDYGKEWEIASYYKGGQFVNEAYFNGAQYPLVTGEPVIDTPDNFCIGDKVEFYDVTDKGDDLDQYIIVVSHYDTEKIDVDTDVKDSDAKKDITAYITVGDVDTNNVDLEGYDAATYKDEAVIAVAYYDGDYTTTSKSDILDSYVPEKLTGTVTKLGSKISIDGTTYDYTAYYAGADLYDFDGDLVELDNKYDFYLINGYVDGADLVDTKSKTYYGMLVKASTSAGTWGDGGLAKIVKADGTVESYEVDLDEVTTLGQYVYASDDNAYLVEYTLNDKNIVDSLEEGDTWVKSDVKMKNGILSGKEVAETAVAFYYDDIDEEWSVYKYDDLKAASEISTATMIDDSNMKLVALELTDSLTGDANSVIALVTDAHWYRTSGSKGYYEVTALVDGVEKEYVTTTGSNPPAPDENTFYKFTLNANGEISNVTAMDRANLSDIDEDLDKTDIGVYTEFSGSYPYTRYRTFTVVDRSGSNLEIRRSETKRLSVGSLYVYSWDAEEGEFVWTVEKLNTLELNVDTVSFLQTTKAQTNWNVVVQIKDDGQHSSLMKVTKVEDLFSTI